MGAVQQPNLRADGHGIFRSAKAGRFATPMLCSLNRRFAVLQDEMCQLKFESSNACHRAGSFLPDLRPSSRSLWPALSRAARCTPSSRRRITSLPGRTMFRNTPASRSPLVHPTQWYVSLRGFRVNHRAKRSVSHASAGLGIGDRPRIHDFTRVPP